MLCLLCKIIKLGYDLKRWGVTLHLVWAQLILDIVVRSNNNLIIHMVNVRTLAFVFVASTFQFPIRIAIGMVKNYTAATSYVLIIYTDEQNYRPLRY